MKATLNRPVLIRDILGLDYSLSASEMLVLLRKQPSQIYLVCVFVLLVAGDAPGYYGVLSLGTLLGLWIIILGLYLVSLWCLLLGLAAVQATENPVRLPAPLINAVAILPGTVLGEWLAAAASYGVITFSLFPQILFYFVIAEVFGLIYIRYVRPALDQEAAEPSPAKPQPDRRIVIGAEPVPLSRLRHVEAREHHVHVTLDGHCLTQRARLSDIVAQTAPEDGLQPHRSWWVARGTARRLERDGQRHVLHLEDGTCVPVARTRLDDVRSWLARHGTERL